ncbi:HNH endonuclease [Streptomyces avermitilis]|nr:HNH endonuclease [Streptomyces avermitilis]
MLRPRAQVVDHIDGLGPLGPRAHDWTNLRAMTTAHHNRRTMRDQGNGT